MHKRVTVVFGFLLVCHAVVGTPRGLYKVTKHVGNSYIVLLETSNKNVPTAASELALIHGGRLRKVWPELNSFSIDLPNEKAAIALSNNPQVAYVQENGELAASTCGQ